MLEHAGEAGAPDTGRICLLCPAWLLDELASFVVQREILIDIEATKTRKDQDRSTRRN